MANTHPWPWWIQRQPPPPPTIAAAMGPGGPNPGQVVAVSRRLYAATLPLAKLYEELLRQIHYVPTNGEPYDAELLNFALISQGFRPLGGSPEMPRCDPVPIRVRLAHPRQFEYAHIRENLWWFVLDAWHETLAQWFQGRRDAVPDYAVSI